MERVACQSGELVCTKRGGGGGGGESVICVLIGQLRGHEGWMQDRQPN